MSKTLKEITAQKEDVIFTTIQQKIKVEDIKSKFYFEIVLNSGVITGDKDLGLICSKFGLNYDSLKANRAAQVKRQILDAKRQHRVIVPQDERVYIRKLGGTIRKVLTENYRG